MLGEMSLVEKKVAKQIWLGKIVTIYYPERVKRNGFERPSKSIAVPFGCICLKVHKRDQIVARNEWIDTKMYF